MTLGKRIGQYRKQLGLTQEGLAQRLDVTNQAVSKWESDQCCPDIAQLPKLADLFGITMDELFGREIPTPPTPEEPEIPFVEAEVVEEPEFEAAPEEEPWHKTPSLFEKLFRTTVEKVNQAAERADQRLKNAEIKSEPGGREVPIPEAVVPDWEDDDTLRVVIFRGKRMVEHHPARERIEVRYRGPVLNVHSECDLSCDSVGGNASAGGDVSCDQVYGNVSAGGDVSCDAVLGHVKAGGDVSCDGVGGNVAAGGDVSCDGVGGSVTAGGDVEIG